MARQQGEQRRLATSVWAYQTDPFARPNRECCVFDEAITDSTFYNNCYIGFDYSFFQNDLVTPIANGVGVNIELDPLLDNNYAPQGDSPCIGAGIQPLSLTDYNGDTRKSLAGFDIGAVWFDGPMDTTVERLLASGGTK